MLSRRAIGLSDPLASWLAFYRLKLLGEKTCDGLSRLPGASLQQKMRAVDDLDRESSDPAGALCKAAGGHETVRLATEVENGHGDRRELCPGVHAEDLSQPINKNIRPHGVDRSAHLPHERGRSLSTDEKEPDEDSRKADARDSGEDAEPAKAARQGVRRE